MRSHIFVHHATTKYFSNSFVFKTEIEKEGLPRDSTPDLGAGSPQFKSARPDHLSNNLCFAIVSFSVHCSRNCSHPRCFSGQLHDGLSVVHFQLFGSFHFVRISRVDISHSHLDRFVSKKRGQRKHVHSSLRSPGGICVPEIVGR